MVDILKTPDRLIEEHYSEQIRLYGSVRFDISYKRGWFSIMDNGLVFRKARKTEMESFINNLKTREVVATL